MEPDVFNPEVWIVIYHLCVISRVWDFIFLTLGLLPEIGKNQLRACGVDEQYKGLAKFLPRSAIWGYRRSL